MQDAHASPPSQPAARSFRRWWAYAIAMFVVATSLRLLAFRFQGSDLFWLVFHLSQFPYVLALVIACRGVMGDGPSPAVSEICKLAFSITVQIILFSHAVYAVCGILQLGSDHANTMFHAFDSAAYNRQFDLAIIVGPVMGVAVLFAIASGIQRHGLCAITAVSEQLVEWRMVAPMLAVIVAGTAIVNLLQTSATVLVTTGSVDFIIWQSTFGLLRLAVLVGTFALFVGWVRLPRRFDIAPG